MLSLIRHSSLPLPIKTFMERVPLYFNPVYWLSQESLALDNCSRRLISITWSEYNNLVILFTSTLYCNADWLIPKKALVLQNNYLS